MSEHSTIRAEMQTRAAHLPVDSSLPATKQAIAPKRSSALLIGTCIVVALGFVWWLKRG